MPFRGCGWWGSGWLTPDPFGVDEDQGRREDPCETGVHDAAPTAFDTASSGRVSMITVDSIAPRVLPYGMP